MSRARSSIDLDSDSDSDLNREEVELHAITSLTKKQQAFVKFIDELIAGGNVIDEAEQKKAAELNYEIIKIFRNNCDMIHDKITVDQLQTGFEYNDRAGRFLATVNLQSKNENHLPDHSQRILALTNTIRLLERIRDNIKDVHITAKLAKRTHQVVVKCTIHALQNSAQELFSITHEDSAQESFNITQQQRLLLEMVELVEERLPKNKENEFFNLFSSADEDLGAALSSGVNGFFSANWVSIDFETMKENIRDNTIKCTLDLADKLVEFSDNLSRRDFSLSRKEMFQALAIGFLAVVTIGLLIGFAIASHGLILPPLLLLFGKAGAAAATSAVGTSAVANTATVVGLAGVSSLGLFMPTVLRKYWARSDMKEKAAEFKETVTPKAS